MEVFILTVIMPPIMIVGIIIALLYSEEKGGMRGIWKSILLLIYRTSRFMALLQIVMLLYLFSVFSGELGKINKALELAYNFNSFLFVFPLVIVYWREKHAVNALDNLSIDDYFKKETPRFYQRMFDLNTRFYLGLLYTIITFFILAYFFLICESVYEYIFDMLYQEVVANKTIDSEDTLAQIQFFLRKIPEVLGIEIKDVVGWLVTIILAFLGMLFGYFKILNELIGVKYKVFMDEK